LILLLAASAGRRPARQKAELSGLWPDQAIKLAETMGRFEIGILHEMLESLTREMIAAGDDCVAVKDIVGFVETVISGYSIKSVKTLRLPK